MSRKSLFPVASYSANHPILFRVRLLQEEPHSQELAEAAVGLGVVENWRGHIKRADNAADKADKMEMAA